MSESNNQINDNNKLPTEDNFTKVNNSNRNDDSIFSNRKKKKKYIKMKSEDTDKIKNKQTGMLYLFKYSCNK